MPLVLDDKLVVGVSSRALFDLEEENRIFEEQGLQAYCEYQLEHEDDILRPGTAFPLIKALHNLNHGEQKLTEIIVMSKNSADTSLRIFNSIKHYGLDISRAALVGGRQISPYLQSFRTDLFLSANEEDVQEAIRYISLHSTRHSEAIITENTENAELFTAAIDSAAVYVNASTRFTDGGEFGLGCEIGISTQKLHARGPMGLEELTTYKYVISGNGQVR